MIHINVHVYVPHFCLRYVCVRGPYIYRQQFAEPRKRLFWDDMLVSLILFRNYVVFILQGKMRK